MADEKKQNLIRKLQALAERGVGGEQETARRKIAELMAKYDIEEMDLSEEKVEVHDFQYHGEFEERLLCQVIYKNAEMSDIYKKSSGKGSRNTYFIYCTKSQAVQIQIEYDFYRDLWKEEIDLFYKAFVNKHHIFPESAEFKNTLSKEETKRLMFMMLSMQEKSPVLRIEGGD
ncbi:MAG: DUF2786 domain-containing protein [Lachnospiraceae bacterium]|nr:DUF2786 domain-containing protein [Lachnospiraceae bacterium]